MKTKVKEITIVQHTLSPFLFKLAKTLKANGLSVNLISFFKAREEYISLFNHHYYVIPVDQKHESKLKKTRQMLRFIRDIRKVKHSVLIGVSEPNWFISFVFFLLRKHSLSTLYYPYDITFFRKKNYTDNSLLKRVCEKYNFTHCTGIIHKGPDEQLNWLPDSFHAQLVPSIQFLTYCDDELLLPVTSQSEKTKQSNTRDIQLVYVGRVVHKSSYRYSDIDIFKKILNQGFSIDVYAMNYDLLHNDDEYKDLLKNPRFTIHKPIYGKDLHQALRTYDWGLCVFKTNFEKMKPEWAKTAYGNKISTYLEAGIPTIVNEELAFSASLVKEKSLGITIETIEDLKDTIERVDYQQILDTLKNTRKTFTLKGNIDRLLQFIDQTVEVKKRG